MNKKYINPLLHPAKAGFTLIELLVVVLIIGILSAVALPQYQLSVEKSRLAEVYTVVHKIEQNLTMIELSDAKFASNEEAAEAWLEDVGLPLEEGGVSGLKYAASKHFCYNPSMFGLIIMPKPCTDIDTAEYVMGFMPKSATSERVFMCQGKSDFGKKLCKSLCGAEECSLPW